MLDMKEEKKKKVNFFIGKFLPKFDLKIVILTNTLLQKFTNKNTLIGIHLSKTQNNSYLIYISFLNHNFVLRFMKTNQQTNIWTSMVTNT